MNSATESTGDLEKKFLALGQAIRVLYLLSADASDEDGAYDVDEAAVPSRINAIRERRRQLLSEQS